MKQLTLINIGDAIFDFAFIVLSAFLCLLVFDATSKFILLIFAGILMAKILYIGLFKFHPAAAIIDALPLIKGLNIVRFQWPSVVSCFSFIAFDFIYPALAIFSGSQIGAIVGAIEWTATSEAVSAFFVTRIGALVISSYFKTASTICE